MYSVFAIWKPDFVLKEWMQPIRHCFFPQLNICRNDTYCFIGCLKCHLNSITIFEWLNFWLAHPPFPSLLFDIPNKLDNFRAAKLKWLFFALLLFRRKVDLWKVYIWVKKKLCKSNSFMTKTQPQFTLDYHLGNPHVLCRKNKAYS